KIVIIQTLNFRGATRRLERDPYLNILGRAGRTGVSAETVVILVDSDSRTLRNYVSRVLWSEAAPLRVRGQIGTLDLVPSSLEERSQEREIQSQVLAWLGEGGAGMDNHPSELARRSLSW